MKVLITTGGTGGHIYPAIALADELKKHYANSDILFIGNSDRMETEIIPALGYRFIGIEAARFNEANNKLAALRLLYRSYKKCIGLVSEYLPDVVVGFGGYVTVPVIMAAVKLGIKTVIHEQNSIAGMANKMLGHFVDKVVTVYPEASPAFPQNKVVCLGNPRESAVNDFHKDKLMVTEYGLDAARKTVLAVMGSLGSQSVNEKMKEVINRVKEKPYNLIYVTGKNNYDEFMKDMEESDNVKILPYVDQFRLAGNVNLIVSRAGATSCCEYMALGAPAIFIPSPYVPNNHQFINAKSMLDNGAAMLLEEKDLSPDNLISMIDEVINDDEKLREMGEKARAMSHPNAAEDIVKLIYETVGKEYERTE